MKFFNTDKHYYSLRNSALGAQASEDGSGAFPPLKFPGSPHHCSDQ